jgi:hypothetical protein
MFKNDKMVSDKDKISACKDQLFFMQKIADEKCRLGESGGEDTFHRYQGRKFLHRGCHEASNQVIAKADECLSFTKK